MQVPISDNGWHAIGTQITQDRIIAHLAQKVVGAVDYSLPSTRCISDGDRLPGQERTRGAAVSQGPRTESTDPMKKILLASACIFALATPTAFAQTSQPSPGASSQGNVGPGASEGAGAMKQGTTGASSRPSANGDASTSGAGTAAGPNNTGAAKETGAVHKGVNKQ